MYYLDLVECLITNKMKGRGLLLIKKAMASGLSESDCNYVELEAQQSVPLASTSTTTPKKPIAPLEPVCNDNELEFREITLSTSTASMSPAIMRDVTLNELEDNMEIAPQQNTEPPSTNTKVIEDVLANHNEEQAENSKAPRSTSNRSQLRPSYFISPVNSEGSDFDDSDKDCHYTLPTEKETYRPVFPITRKRSHSSASSSSSSSSSSSDSSSSSSSYSSSSKTEIEISNNSVTYAVSDTNYLSRNDHLEASTSQPIINPPPTATDHEASTSQPITNPPPKSKKRVRNPAAWVVNVKKALRNSGKAYENANKKKVAERTIQPPCNDNCKLKCKVKINEYLRTSFFDSYWKLGDLQKQREFIVRHTEFIKPKYRYSSTENFRALNSAFFFDVDGIRVRVCKT